MTVDTYDPSWMPGSPMAIALNLAIGADARARGRDVVWDHGWYRIRFPTKRMARKVAHKARSWHAERFNVRKDAVTGCHLCDKMQRRARRRRHHANLDMVHATAAVWAEQPIPF